MKAAFLHSDDGIEEHLRAPEQKQLLTGNYQHSGLVHLQRMTSLQSLNLGYTKVSDTGPERLKGLTRLQRLNLEGTKVADAGLVHLKGLTRLKTLSLARTQVTDAGVKELKAALPNCRIAR